MYFISVAASQPDYVVYSTIESMSYPLRYYWQARIIVVEDRTAALYLRVKFDDGAHADVKWSQEECFGQFIDYNGYKQAAA